MPDPIDLNTLSNQTTEDGGGIMVRHLEGSNVSLKLLPVNDVKENLDKASTALQPEEVGDMAYEDKETYMQADDVNELLATRDAQITFLTVQLANLSSLIGADLIRVLDDDILEDDIVA